MYDSPPAQHQAERFPTAIPFVGRERELALVQHALDQALAGHGRVVLLSGEPGIGKTRTAEEFTASARSLGCQVLWSACDEWEGAPAYWPWVQVIRSIVRGRDATTLRNLLGSGGLDVARIVPELRTQHAPPSNQPTGNEETARFRLFDSASTFLIEVAKEAPVVVVLDDLHWADTPSLLLLQFIAQHLRDAPLLILGTYRTAEVGHGHPLAEVLGELTRTPGNARIVLNGLSHSETRDITTAVVGHELPARIVDVVQHETEGNPFFVTEIARFLNSEREMTPPGTVRGGLHFHVPETVKDVIGQRLHRLPAECQALLSIASVIGREFSLRTLAAVSELPVETVLEQLDDALQARLIDAGATLSTYRFHHALVQDTIYDTLPPSRRLRLHRQVGQALETLTAPDADPPLDELSYHFFQAAPLGEAEKALTYATRAAEQAMRILAWESAIEHYGRALQLVALATGTTLQRCDLLLALGDAQTLAERSNRGSPVARETFLRAAELARTAGSGEHLAHAALGFAGRNLVTTPGGDRQVALLEEALDRLGADDSILRVRVLGRLAIDRLEVDLPANPRLLFDPSSRIRRLSDEAITIARRIDDPATLAFALLAKRSACATHDNLSERIALSTEGIERATAAGDVELQWWGSTLLHWDYAEAGDRDRERQALVGQVSVTQLAPTPFRESGIFSQQAEVALREGDYTTAEELATRALGGMALVQAPWQFLLLRREQDRLHEIKGELVHLADRQDVTRVYHALHVLLAVDLGRDDARTLFNAMASNEFIDIGVTDFWLETMAVLTEACLSFGDRQRAQLLYELLLPYADRLVAILMTGTHRGAVSRFLGMLATLLDRYDDAECHFAHALEVNERLGLRPFVAHTQHAWADMLVRRGEASDRDRARELNAQALAAAREIGMVRLQRMAEALEARLMVEETPDSVQIVAPSGLTKREVEVLRLIGAGKNNPEIAETLFLSVRTVERHVENLYRKIDVNSRAEAIAFALRHADR